MTDIEGKGEKKAILKNMYWEPKNNIKLCNWESVWRISKFGNYLTPATELEAKYIENPLYKPIQETFDNYQHRHRNSNYQKWSVEVFEQLVKESFVWRTVFFARLDAAKNVKSKKKIVHGKKSSFKNYFQLQLYIIESLDLGLFQN